MLLNLPMPDLPEPSRRVACCSLAHEAMRCRLLGYLALRATLTLRKSAALLCKLLLTSTIVPVLELPVHVTSTVVLLGHV